MIEKQDSKNIDIMPIFVSIHVYVCVSVFTYVQINVSVFAGTHQADYLNKYEWRGQKITLDVVPQT